MGKAWVRAALVAIAAMFMVGTAAAQTPLKISGINMYLIWEDTAKMSKNIGDLKDEQFTAVDPQLGGSSQVIVDVFYTGDKNGLYEDKSTLVVTATEFNNPTAILTEKRWPVVFVGPGGRGSRTIVVEHRCLGIEVAARIDVGKKIGKEFRKTLNVTCGD